MAWFIQNDEENAKTRKNGNRGKAEMACELQRYNN
jgi:hypothetical protein